MISFGIRVICLLFDNCDNTYHNLHFKNILDSLSSSFVKAQPITTFLAIIFFFHTFEYTRGITSPQAYLTRHSRLLGKAFFFRAFATNHAWNREGKIDLAWHIFVMEMHSNLHTLSSSNIEFSGKYQR